MQILINPGTGPVADATEAHGQENIRQFAADCGFDDIEIERAPEADYGEGRYAFRLKRPGGDVTHEIQMPGLPLVQVRYLKEPGQSILRFPRLYVDGSSYVWCYALLCQKSDWAPDWEPAEEDIGGNKELSEKSRKRLQCIARHGMAALEEKAAACDPRTDFETLDALNTEATNSLAAIIEIADPSVCYVCETYARQVAAAFERSQRFQQWHADDGDTMSAEDVQEAMGRR